MRDARDIVSADGSVVVRLSRRGYGSAEFVFRGVRVTTACGSFRVPDVCRLSDAAIRAFANWLAEAGEAGVVAAKRGNLEPRLLKLRGEAARLEAELAALTA